MVEIEIVDSVWTRTNKDGHYWLNNVLCYDHFYWRRDGFKNEKVVQKVWMLETHTDGFYFHTGLVERVLTYLEDNNVPHTFTSELPDVDVVDPQIEGITFRPYQQRLIDAGLDHGRGQLIAPTATGKSIILNGIISGFPTYHILFLVHTKDLRDQMKEHLCGAFPDEEIGEWSTDIKQIERITVATIQSYVKVHKKYNELFQVILIDEMHHVSNLSTQYAQILQMSTAHTKIGVTATHNAKEQGKWTAEALLGPVIGEYTLKEAREDGVIAEPTIHIYRNPPVECYSKLPEYSDKYQFGITDNVIRNVKIVTIAKEFINAGKVVLITVVAIEHGLELERMFARYGLDIKFVYGGSSKKERKETKEGLKDGSIRAAISSVIFLEGIDIPNLDVVINGGAGVSPVHVMQRIGRALRKTETKSTAILVDFIDDVLPTLRRQSDKRISIYEEHEWKIIYKG